MGSWRTRWLAKIRRHPCHDALDDDSGLSRSLSRWEGNCCCRDRSIGQSWVGAEHELGADELVEGFAVEESELEGRLLERLALGVREFGTLGDVYADRSVYAVQDERRTVVSERAVEDGREHERLVEELGDAVLVGGDADDTVLGE